MLNPRKIKTILLVPIFLSGLSSAAFSQEVAIENGLTNLYSAQNPDGSWGGIESSINGVFPSTTTVVDALKLLELIPSANQTNAYQYLLNEELNVTDYLSRRNISLSGTGNDTTADVDAVLALQNPDGGWGGAEGFGSNNLDTTLALMALASAGSTESGAINGATSYLLASQDANGGWGLISGDRSEIYYTGKVMQALLTQAQTLQIANALSTGTSFLLNHQNPDGGFGESGSTIWETALSFLGLSMTSGDITAKLNAIDYLSNSQLTNGSWSDDPYSTALALQALKVAEVFEAAPTVEITSVSLFNSDRIPSSVYGAYETMAIQISVTDTAVGLNVFVEDTDGSVFSTAALGTEFFFEMRNRPPGDYRLIVRALDKETGIILDQQTTSFEIIPGVAIENPHLQVNPLFSHAGATETLSATLIFSNRSNQISDLTIEFNVTTPGGTGVIGGTVLHVLNPQEILVTVPLVSTTIQFAESGDYQVEARVLEGESLIALAVKNISVSPLLRIEPDKTLIPDTVLPDGDHRIKINIHLEGIEEE